MQSGGDATNVVFLAYLSVPNSTVGVGFNW